MSELFKNQQVKPYFKKCPFCGKENQADAIFCNYCGKDTRKAPKQKKFPWATCLIAALVLAIIAVVGIGLIGEQLDKSYKEVDKKLHYTDRRDTYNICVSYIKEHLLSPTSAKFQEYNEYAVYIVNENKFLANPITVDAQNTFGVFIRKSFSCEATKTDTGLLVTDLKENE